ncbi:hypothetical protein ACA910_004223 [Epithemia clementina (nom. ined.)]
MVHPFDEDNHSVPSDEGGKDGDDDGESAILGPHSLKALYARLKPIVTDAFFAVTPPRVTKNPTFYHRWTSPPWSRAHCSPHSITNNDKDKDNQEDDDNDKNNNIMKRSHKGSEEGSRFTDGVSGDENVRSSTENNNNRGIPAVYDDCDHLPQLLSPPRNKNCARPRTTQSSLARTPLPSIPPPWSDSLPSSRHSPPIPALLPTTPPRNMTSLMAPPGCVGSYYPDQENFLHHHHNSRMESPGRGGVGVAQAIGPPHLRIYKVRLPSYMIPLLDPLVERAEVHAASLTHGWNTNLFSLTKRDFVVHDIPGGAPLCQPIMDFVCSSIHSLYGAARVFLDQYQPHILKYSAHNEDDESDDTHNGSQRGVALHQDSCSGITANLMMSSSDDYEGGGTVFAAFNTTVHLAKGEFLLHPGNLVHGGRNIESGNRYLLVFFCQVDFGGSNYHL